LFYERMATQQRESKKKFDASAIHSQFCSVYETTSNCRETLKCSSAPSALIRKAHLWFSEALNYQCKTLKEASESVHRECYMDKGALLKKFGCFQNFMESQETMTASHYSCSYFVDYLKCVRSAAVRLQRMEDASVNSKNCTTEMVLAAFKVTTANMKPFLELVCVGPQEQLAGEELQDEFTLAGHRGSAHSLLIGCGLLVAWILVSSQPRW